AVVMSSGAEPYSGSGSWFRSPDTGGRSWPAPSRSASIVAARRHRRYRPPRMILRLILRRESAVLLALLVAGCETPKTVLEVSREHLQHGNVPLAFHALKAARDDEMLRKGAVDPELEAEYQSLRIRYELEEARQEIFEDRELRALLLLAEVKELAPHHSEVDDLIDRAHRKLALRAAKSGFNHLAKGELDKALLDFDESQHHEP